MTRFTLLAGIGAAALMAIPAVASAETTSDPSTTFTENVDIDIDYDNSLDTSLETHAKFNKWLALFGGAIVKGEIDVDAAAIAISDTKQLIEGNSVLEFDSGHDEANRVLEFNVNSSGNVGVNAAAGAFNSQANVATIASAVAHSGEKETGNPHITTNTNDPPGGGNPHNNGGGWAEASTTALQKLLNNSYVGGITNAVAIGTVGGTGNVGVNAAAGAFNIQENVLTLASVTDSSLAEANAGVLQVTMANDACIETTDNNVVIGGVTGTGNIGVNAAAGVGNMQHNSLTVASALANGS